MEKGLEKLKDYWVLIIFLGGLIFSWAMFSARLSQAEEKITRLEAIMEAVQQIQVDVAIIRTRVDNIDKKI